MNIAVAKDDTIRIDAVFFVNEYLVGVSSEEFSDAFREATRCFDPPRIDVHVVSRDDKGF
jgi:hypothetical protein